MSQVPIFKFQEKGFTLVELLVVIFIIGLLASTVLVGLGTFRARGRDTRRIADLNSMRTVLELYYATTSEYPAAANWDELRAMVVQANVGVGVLPNDPITGQDYKYGVSANHQRYVLGAELEDDNNSALRDDIDGSGADNYGINCDDPVYCIKF